MDQIRKFREWFMRQSPTFDENVLKKPGFTTKLIYNRSRVGIHRALGPGSHMEAEHYLFNRRFNLPMFKHFRYLGGRGEFFIYFLVVVALKRLITYNLQREVNIESLLNDRNTFFAADLPVKYRKLN